MVKSCPKVVKMRDRVKRSEDEKLVVGQRAKEMMKIGHLSENASTLNLSTALL